MGAFLRNRAGRSPHRANLRCLGHTATIACAVLLVSGCLDKQPAPPDAKKTNAAIYYIAVESNPSIAVIYDGATGCQYITTKRGYGETITPRLGDDGKPICGRGGQ